MHQKDKIIHAICLAYKRPPSEQSISPPEIEQYVKSVRFLEDILLFGRTAFFIIDCKNLTYLYCSSNVNEVLGWEIGEFMAGGPVFGLTRFNPQDLTVQAQIHPFMINYLERLPEDEKTRYKFSFTSRLIKKNGKEVNLLQNNFFIKTDEQGNAVIKIITFTDITAYKKNDDIIFYVSRMTDEGKNTNIIQKCFSPNRDINISDREIEILECVASGISNVAVANRLGLSKNTIKNHKKNIMRKLGCSNTSHMIKLSSLYGLISSQYLGSDMRSKSR